MPVLGSLGGSSTKALVPWSKSFLKGGLLDTAFAAGAGTALNSSVLAVAVQLDRKILIGGNFTTFNGASAPVAVRINANGTRDVTFLGNNDASLVQAIAIQSDQKILVGGNFTTWNGATVNNIVRLNSNGTRDTAFTTNTGTGTNSAVTTIAIQPDGKIVLGGGFTTWNGVTVNRIVRLNADGTRDTAFTTNAGTAANLSVNVTTIQSDGKIIVGGSFTTWGGVTVNRIVRLNADGTRDTAFTTNTGTGAPDSSVSAIAVQSDGKIVLGGGFTGWNGTTTVGGIVRLNSDGTRETAFTANTGTGAVGTVFSIALQSDGKIVLGIGSTTWNGVTVNRIVRLNADGTRDTAFTTNTGTGANNFVNTIAVQSDGKIVLGGGFTGFNNINRSRLARIGGGVAV